MRSGFTEARLVCDRPNRADLLSGVVPADVTVPCEELFSDLGCCTLRHVHALTTARGARAATPACPRIRGSPMRVRTRIDGKRVSLVFISRSEVEYTEGWGCLARRMRIGGELLANGMMIEAYTVGQWTDGTAATPDERRRVLRNIERLSESSEWPIFVEYGMSGR